MGLLILCELCLNAVNAVMAVKSFQAAVVDPNINFLHGYSLTQAILTLAKNATIIAATHTSLRTLTICLIFSHTGSL